MIHLITSLYLFVGIIVFILAFKSLKQNTLLGKKMFLILLLAGSITLLYSILLFIDLFILKSFLNSMIFTLASLILILLLDFTYEYTEIKKRKTLFIVLKVIFIIEAILFLTNPWHHKFMSYTIGFINNMYILQFAITPPIIIYFTISYSILLTVIFLLVKKCMSVPHIYRIKYSVYIYSLSILIVLNFLFASSTLYLDVSIIIYGIIGSFFYIFTFEFKPIGFINKTYKLIFNNMHDPIVLFDYKNSILQYNESFTKVFSNISNEKLINLNMYSFLKLINLDINNISSKKSFESKLNTGKNKKYFEIDCIPIIDKKNRLTGTLFSFQDIDELKNVNRELKEVAITDPLTGLNNKFDFDYRAENVWNEYDSLPQSLAIININNLKFINNCFGTTTGDEVIQFLGITIKSTIGKENYAARLYGEDIVIITPNLKEKEASKIIKKIQSKFSNNKGFTFNINFEYGIVEKSNNITTIFDMLNNAREIMTNKKILSANSLKSSLLESLKKSLIDNDFETEAHVERVNNLAIELSEKLDLPEKEVTQLSLLALLHDIGKIAIPDYILLKPGKLNDEEWEIMKHHTTKGFRIANSYPELTEISNLILSHHERWDGKGYPNGLKADEIPLLAQIITVLDSYDVMTNDRPYHKAISQDAAIEELKRCSGTQFSPKIVDAFIELLDEKKQLNNTIAVI